MCRQKTAAVGRKQENKKPKAVVFFAPTLLTPCPSFSLISRVLKWKLPLLPLSQEEEEEDEEEEEEEEEESVPGYLTSKMHSLPTILLLVRFPDSAAAF